MLAPASCIHYPWPNQRFTVKHPRWKSKKRGLILATVISVAPESADEKKTRSRHKTKTEGNRYHVDALLSDLPKGLYVEYSQRLPWDASACVLPHVGREQTEEIIRKIMDRFPDTGKLAVRPPEPAQLVSLNLNVATNR
jgi:hypothetical protein